MASQFDSVLKGSTFLATGVVLVAASPALAQSTEPTGGEVRITMTQTQGQDAPLTRDALNAGDVNAPDDAGAQVGEVVVTGSRISRRDYVADSPVVSVGPKAFENTGAVTLDRLFNEIPQFVPGQGAQNNNPGDGQTNIQLRGLGTTRNLVLLDGRRIVPSRVDGEIDINTIPQALIENIEVVTGGQSTSYGSDAIAGVVNFKLKHNFQGVAIDSSYGVSDQGDAQETNVNVTAGANFDDKRGNAVISLGYSNRDAVFYGARPDVTRSDFATISASVSNPRILAVSGLSGTKPQGAALFLGSNLPSQAAVNALFATKYGFTLRTIPNSYGFGFNNDGTLFNGPADYKGPTSIDYSTITSAGVSSNGGLYNTGATNYVQLPITRYNAFSRVEYNVTPHISAYGQLLFTESQSQAQLAPTPAANNPTGVASLLASGGTGFLVAANNPFIPADLRTLLNSRADPNAPFVLNKRFNDLGGRVLAEDNINYQSIVGLKGDIPGRDVTFDLYAAYGRLERSENQSGNISHANLAAVLANPATAGAGACSTYNPFGLNGLPASCAAYISPSTKNAYQYAQRIVEGDLQGRAFQEPTFGPFGGGEVRFAFGADYRDDRASLSPDALLSSYDTSTNSYTLGGVTYNLVNNTSGVGGFNGGQPVSGDIDVYEAYGELLIPIVGDQPFFKSLNLDVGGRYSDYSTIGPAYTYKADLEWRPMSWLLLRGGYSRAIRAPNITELFVPATNTFLSIGSASAASLGSGDPCDVTGAARKGLGVNAAAVRALCLAQGVPATVIDSFQASNTQVQELTGGNPALHRERANTYTGGFVVTPHFSIRMFNHLSASVDYYNIEINSQVSTIDPLTQLNYCFNETGANPNYANAYSICQLFARDPSSGQIVSGSATDLNLGGVRTSGVDLQVDWTFALSALPYLNLRDRWGSLALNLSATWLNDYDVQAVPAGDYLNYRDSIASDGGAFPVWKALLNANYAVGPFDFGVVERYIGKARDGGCVGLSSVCTLRGVDPEFYTDLNARWKINDILELRAGVTNVANQAPRFFSTANSADGQSDASTYDLIGRRYFVGLKARL